ncbi:MAG: HD domain-containing protein [candidate division Zixibacteria bacterium]|nr:HD domain-containing protein [candidate division Zixibacteria bacterium]MDD5427574.1 HD domain-containing protein [candidate division Zixibacteria bacterium]
MASTAVKKRVEQKFLPIYLDSLRVDSVLDFDLYIKVNNQLVLYRSADLPFTERTRQKLIDNRVERLFITNENRANYQIYIEKNLDKILTDTRIREEKKAGILYETSTNLVKDVLNNPTYGDNIKRSQSLVSNTIEFILKGREAFLNLLKITSFDYYTYTHSVNVCTFAIALAQQLGFKDEEFLNELGVGALLHDIGKSKISERILNKRSALNQIEFEIMKKHPKWGVEILAETDQITQNCYFPVLQHHERGDRRGYPSRLSLDEVHIYSKIVAIVDSFDAMTTERVYQKAIDTFPALKIMFNLKGAYDERILTSFVELMGPSGLLEI